MKFRILQLSVFSLALLFFAFSGGMVFAQVDLSIGLVARFDVNGNTLDSSGNGHDAVVSGLHSYVADRFGNPASALQVDAPGVLAEGDGIALSGSSLSLSFWYQKYWDPLDRAIVRVGTESAAGKQLIVQLDYPITTQADLRFSFFFDDFDLFTNPSQATDRWYHAVLTYDNVTTERRIYMDGVLAGNNLAAYGFSGNDHFDFGMLGIAIDDLAFYNRVLSPDEASALYAVPEPSSCLLILLGGIFWISREEGARLRRVFRL